MVSLFQQDNLPFLIGGSVFTIAAGIAIKKMLFNTKSNFPAVPDGTVLLHQFSGGGMAPSLSPYPIKLETYLRMAKIPYENHHSFVMGPKGKLPWMTYNGVNVADSQFCIDYLNKQLGVNLNSKLSAEERAVAHAFRVLMEDNIYWVHAVQRWIEDGPAGEFVQKAFGMDNLSMWVVRGTIRKSAYAQGMGRHTKEEGNQIAEKSLTALSDFIGSKKYLMGDEPCEEDCVIFGMLCQPVYNMPGSYSESLVNGKLSNLKEYCARMKEAFWPDWEEIISARNKKQK